MTAIRNFHAHIYFNADQVEQARALGDAAGRFGVPAGHYHLRPVGLRIGERGPDLVGPHPRGSCQLTVPPEVFGEFAQWMVLNRGGLTIFAHATTGDDLADHTHNVIWFGPSEPLDLSIFD